MTNKQLKHLKDSLWAGADQLRANSGLKSTEYSTPILGLIFLRFAQSKYDQFEAAIQAEYNKHKGTRAEQPIHEIAIRLCGYYLPPEAKYDYLLNLPESADLARATKTAMEEIERYTEGLVDTLPKDVYYTVNSEDDPLVLSKLFKVFKDIPTDVSLDIFGEIYEYFLGNFALSEGQGGGEFFTPSTVVRYMVEVLAPTEGDILDPACCCGGFLVACQLITTMLPHADSIFAHRNAEKTNNHKQNANVKLFQGKMYTPGQCKTISNGFFGHISDGDLEQVFSGNSHPKTDAKQEVEKCQIP